ncbi:hypothetical protein [Streptomyces sp. NPDC006638]|uniref:hypothetical protein n=1 Tax=Streptomyces sp. NPDC006638 TaxID=3157183 RepID=UPI0033BE9B62
MQSGDGVVIAWAYGTAGRVTKGVEPGATIGFVREPSGTLVSMRTGGSSQYYVTDALIMPPGAAGLPTWGIVLVLGAFIVAVLVVVSRRR